MSHFVAFVLLFGPQCQGQGESEYYRVAMEWIRKSPEVHRLAQEHLHVSMLRDGPLRCAVFDTLTPSINITFFDSTCAPFIDTREKYIEGIRSVKRGFEFYQPFSEYWPPDSADNLILVFGYVFHNKLIAELFPRVNPYLLPATGSINSTGVFL